MLSLRLAFRRTRVLEVNARVRRTPPVDWRGAYGWILVGGQAMDRGFTVEGLTVTYMPRGIGVGNADTVQQRARFFGYKRSYLGYCRLYLEQRTLSAFQSYVEHEEDIRRQLEAIQQANRPLNELEAGLRSRKSLATLSPQCARVRLYEWSVLGRLGRATHCDGVRSCRPG